ncbi:hypothetical protein H6M51_16065 [Rhizobium sp. AQ_MP]|uniref:hypothetical protein n=1 Tax=Rhizobium sp. AQ_MP TaxID=2761536 RepID=UPI00163B0B05|nr:hypothetical protein [Rhizobium sp. AQ_MP]MBC2774382.1 hypothetical protein [Rhizobium sp. AQ_MP]
MLGWSNVSVASTAQQIASNAGNVIDVRGRPLNSVRQDFEGKQFSVNEIVLNAVSALDSIEQEASNTGNAVIGGDIGNVEQYFANGSVQHAKNHLVLPDLPGTLRQTGTNTMNLVYSQQSVALSSQNFTKQAEQIVDNRLHVTGAGGGGAIVQEGTNLGNIIVARNVNEVIRDFSGDQVVNNVVTLQDGSRWGSISQNGTNIANYIEAENIGYLRQTSSNGRQIVNNRVEQVTLDGLTQTITSPNITQNSNNYVNVIVLKKTLPDGTPQVVEVLQSAEYGQTVQGANAGTVSQTANAVVIER